MPAQEAIENLRSLRFLLFKSPSNQFWRAQSDRRCRPRVPFHNNNNKTNKERK
jgi:hypothetical protein